MKLVVVGDKAEIAGIRRNTTGLSAATQTLSVLHLISAPIYHTDHQNKPQRNERRSSQKTRQLK